MPQVGADLKGLQEFSHSLAYLICIQPRGSKAWEPDNAHIMLCLELVPEREKRPRASTSRLCWHLHPAEWRDVIPEAFNSMELGSKAT